MPPYLFPLPTTSLLTFSQVLLDPSPSGSYSTVLAEATAVRAKLFLALKGVYENESGASALAVLDAVQVYLPYLGGIIACLDADELLYKGDPMFQWRSPLTHYPMSSPLLSLPSIHSEHLFVVLTYTLALSNYAQLILASLPIFEPGPKAGSSSSSHISSDDEKRTAAGLGRAVDLLCQASGVAEWAADNVCPPLERVRAGGRGGKGKWPVEVGAETFRGLAMMLLADAHLTAIRKLLLPVLFHSLFAPPGPPLPSNHPSSSLLSKLYLHVNSLYTSSRALLKVHQSDNSSSSGTSSSSRRFFKDKQDFSENDNVQGEIIPPLKRYLRKESSLAIALSHKWLGVDAGENSKGAKVGEAITWVKNAEKRLEEMEDSKMREKVKGLSIGKGSERKKEERKARKGRVERELDDVRSWVRAYTKMNDTVAFQPVPPISSLITPSGRPIFSAKKYNAPANKFEPTHRLPTGDNGNDDNDGDGDEVDRANKGQPVENYAGKGNYF